MKCPKCGTEIARFDLAPNCKKCGVHILYYTQEEDLMRDAKKTELEFASARLLAAKIKAAFIGGKVQTARIVFILLSVASLLLPHYNVQLSFPWWEYKLSVGAIGIYSIISDAFYKIFLPLGELGAADGLYNITLASFALLIAAVLCVAVCFILWLLSFINIKKTALGSIITAAAAVCCQLTGTVLSFIAVTLSGAYEHISVKPLFGGIVSTVIIGIYAVLCLLMLVNTPEIIIKEADKKRFEIKTKLKNKEITLDELPLPIVKEDRDEPLRDKKKKRGKKK